MTAEFKLLIRDLRQSHELSQDELARALGISRQSIISLERGEYLPSFPLLINMIHFFECSLDQLVEGSPQPIQKVEQQDSSADSQSPMPAYRSDPYDSSSQAVGSSAGAINIHETDTEYEIQLLVPRFKENEINLELSENTLKVSGEHQAEVQDEKKSVIRREWEHSSFSRSIHFIHPIQEEKVAAKLADGILTIHAPKTTLIKPKIKKIEVKK